MWWFLKKSEHRVKAFDEGKPSSLGKHTQAPGDLVAQIPDFSALNRHEAAVKIWLPEEVAKTLKWVADHAGISQSGWVRLQLTHYVYGQVAVLALRLREEKSSVRFSRGPVDRTQGRWIYKVPQLGKNTVAFKLWLSEKMRDDLAILAKHAGVGLSPFVREAVIGGLYGRGTLPERPEVMGVASAEALAWEQGEEVPEIEVQEDAFNGLGAAERVWINTADAAAQALS